VSSVWQHFDFFPNTNKRVCNILDGKGVKCGAQISGKNPTNMKTHLSSHHKALYKEMQEEVLLETVTSSVIDPEALTLLRLACGSKRLASRLK